LDCPGAFRTTLGINSRVKLPNLQQQQHYQSSAVLILPDGSAESV
jgi:hypothetical protein